MLKILGKIPFNKASVTQFDGIVNTKSENKTDRAVGRVHLPTSGVELAFEQRDGVLYIDLPPFSLHELVVIE